MVILKNDNVDFRALKIGNLRPIDSGILLHTTLTLMHMNGCDS